MAEKNVVRQDVVEITWDIEESPLSKLTKQSQTFGQSIKKSVTGGESAISKLNSGVKKTTKNIKELAKSKLSRVTTAANKLKTKFTEGIAKAKAFASSIKKVNRESLSKITSSVTNLGTKLGTGLVTAAKKAARAIAAIGVGAAVGVFKLTDMASDLSETVNKVDVAFGDNASEVKKWSKNSIKDMGMAQQTALDMAAGFGDMGTGMGLSQKASADMSTGLVQLAADLASFKNMEVDEVNTALNGIFTGETESLKRLGVVMTKTNLEDFAKSQGKVLDEMSQSELVMLRYNYVLEKTKNAQGDFARTGGGFANQLRMAKEQLKQIGTTLGGAFISKFEGALQKINSFATTLNEKLGTVLADGFQFEDLAKITPMFGTMGTVIQSVSDKIHAVTQNKEKMALLKSIGEGIKNAFSSIATFAGKVVEKIIEFATQTPVLNTLKGIVNGISKVFQFLGKHIGVVGDILVGVGTFLLTLTGIIKTVTAVSKAWSFVQLIVNSGLLACPITWIVLGIAALIAIIVVLVKNWDKVKAAAVNCWNKIKEAWGIASAWLDEKVIQPIKDAFQGAWDFVTGLWGGITDFFSGLWDGIKGIVSKITGKAGEAKGASDKVKAKGGRKMARGGLLTRPEYVLAGEAGPEMIIPLSANKRNRGLSLWAKAGQMMGVNTPSVSLPSYNPSSSVTNNRSSSQTNNNYSPSFTLNMNGTVDRTTERTIKRWVQEALEDVFDSMSRTSPRLTEV